MNNKAYQETFHELKTKYLDHVGKIEVLTNENNKFKEEIAMLKRGVESKHDFNKEKDSFIKDLLGKIKYLENILRDYQKKYYMPKYTNVLDYKNKTMNSEKLKDLFKNMKVFEKLKNNDIEMMKYNTLKENQNLSEKEDMNLLNTIKRQEIKNEKVGNYKNTFSKRNNSASFIRSKINFS